MRRIWSAQPAVGGEGVILKYLRKASSLEVWVHGLPCCRAAGPHGRSNTASDEPDRGPDRSAPEDCHKEAQYLYGSRPTDLAALGCWPGKFDPNPCGDHPSASNRTCRSQC